MFCTSLKKKVSGMNISLFSNPASTTLHIAGQMEIYGSLMFMGSGANECGWEICYWRLFIVHVELPALALPPTQDAKHYQDYETFSVGKSQPKPGFQPSKQMASTCHCHETKQVACMGNRWPTFEQKCLSYMVEGVTGWCVDSFPFIFLFNNSGIGHGTQKNCQ